MTYSNPPQWVKDKYPDVVSCAPEICGENYALGFHADFTAEFCVRDGMKMLVAAYDYSRFVFGKELRLEKLHFDCAPAGLDIPDYHRMKDALQNLHGLLCRTEAPTSHKEVFRELHRLVNDGLKAGV